MDDQYRMIEQDIDALLDDAITLVPTEYKVATTAVTMKRNSFLPYKCLEVAAKEGPILGQYKKWSTVESDELNIQNHSVEQPTYLPPSVQLMGYNLTVEMVQSILLNFWKTQLQQSMTTPKRMCSFCKKNGMGFATYTSHSLRINGILQCPYLLECQCNYCFKNGHTTSYCPMKEKTTAAATVGLAYRHANNC